MKSNHTTMSLVTMWFAMWTMIVGAVSVLSTCAGFYLLYLAVNWLIQQTL